MKNHAGKVFGFQHLFSCANLFTLSILKLFSSMAALSGSSGQAGYAAANAALNAWAETVQVNSMHVNLINYYIAARI